MDGGIRTGMDVLRALCSRRQGHLHRPALPLRPRRDGARAGVTRVLEIIRNELDTTLALCGRRLVTDAGPEHLQPGSGGAPLA